MKKIYISFLLLLAVTIVMAKDPVKDFVNDPLLVNSNISLLIQDVNDSKPLYEHRSNFGNIPASTMKVVTTATALELLGGDFRFETKLQIVGEISEDGVLNGDLYIVGGGDPTLGSNVIGHGPFLKQWVNAVKKAGIKSITGSIVADDLIFDREGINTRWIWEDIGNYYAAGVYGISYMDNTLRVYMSSGAAGTKPEILNTKPEVPGLIFENHLTSTMIGKDSSYFHGSPRTNYRTIYGEVPANIKDFITKADIPNPGLLLAQHFHDELLNNDVMIAFPPHDQPANYEQRTTIHTSYSAPLNRIVKEINVTSNNHYAEHVFRYLGTLKKVPASNTDAVSVIRNFWKEKGLSVDQLFMYDGSGLSPTNAISARFLVELLTYMKKTSTNSSLFYSSLPVCGESGTVAGMLKNTDLEGKVRAKSGSINRVRCYTGYINQGQKTYAFAVMVNNYSTTRPRTVVKKIEQFLSASMQE